MKRDANKASHTIPANARLIHNEPMKINHPGNLDEGLGLVPEFGVGQKD